MIIDKRLNYKINERELKSINEIKMIGKVIFLAFLDREKKNAKRDNKQKIKEYSKEVIGENCRY